jgi:hypothetical protein
MYAAGIHSNNLRVQKARPCTCVIDTVRLNMDVFIQRFQPEKWAQIELERNLDETSDASSDQSGKSDDQVLGAKSLAIKRRARYRSRLNLSCRCYLLQAHTRSFARSPTQSAKRKREAAEVGKRMTGCFVPTRTNHAHFFRRSCDCSMKKSKSTKHLRKLTPQLNSSVVYASKLDH